MAKLKTSVPQNYPRVGDKGYLDASKLSDHSERIPSGKVKELVAKAVKNANLKSSRAILNIPEKISREELSKIYKKQGKDLLAYFKKYCGDPAATAYDTYKKHYKAICCEQFRNRTLQKERMNSGWRYQYLARDCATESKRFRSVSDIGAAEADFNATIDFRHEAREPLSLYVSIKNRVNTMGGQDWPKAIYALEEIALHDKNRTGPYCCVFGITMDRGERYIKKEQKSNQYYSVNTEIWLSDFFWPFFSGYSYEEIMKIVLETLMEIESGHVTSIIDIPEELIEAFGYSCRKAHLIDSEGIFNDPYKLVEFFCKK